MRLLLDTHALLWWLADDRRLGAQARALIASRDNEILVSSASLWEIVVKIRAGKLEADFGAIEAALGPEGFKRLDISPAHLATLVRMSLHHKDPFDHLLIAQALAEEAVLVLDDRHMKLYPVGVQRCSA
jgi:PIN domain nuclease of toxin-antitoxin system